MIADGFKLMAIGMGMVFIFLSLMVLVINLAARIVAPLAGLLEEKNPASTQRRTRIEKKDDNKNLIAAVTAAVHKYRKDNEED